MESIKAYDWWKKRKAERQATKDEEQHSIQKQVENLHRELGELTVNLERMEAQEGRQARTESGLSTHRGTGD